MITIHCVEDDSSIRELIVYTLNASGFYAIGYDCADSFFSGLENSLPDLVLLDIMLPDMDGMDILRSLRESPKTESLPVILLTAKSDRIDKIKGLDSGADDYITKPFDILELISRIRAILRRSEKIHTDKQTKLVCGILEIDTLSYKVYVNQKEVILTYKEYELLRFLISNSNAVVSRNTLMNEVWGMDFQGETRTVDVHIRTLRQKLGDAGYLIETVRNVGYRVTDNV